MCFFPKKWWFFPKKIVVFPPKMVFFPKRNGGFSNLELVCLFLRRSSGCGSFIQMKMVLDWVKWCYCLGLPLYKELQIGLSWP